MNSLYIYIFWAYVVSIAAVWLSLVVYVGLFSLKLWCFSSHWWFLLLVSTGSGVHRPVAVRHRQLPW